MRTDSEVYGDMVDVEVNGTEVCSADVGPHPLDGNWGIVDPWVGLGFGLERLLMAREGYPNIERAGRSLMLRRRRAPQHLAGRTVTLHPRTRGGRGRHRRARPPRSCEPSFAPYLPSSASIFLTPSLASSA